VEMAILRAKKKEAEDKGQEVRQKGNQLTIDGVKYEVKDNKLVQTDPGIIE